MVDFDLLLVLFVLFVFVGGVVLHEGFDQEGTTTVDFDLLLLLYLVLRLRLVQC